MLRLFMLIILATPSVFAINDFPQGPRTKSKCSIELSKLWKNNGVEEYLEREELRSYATAFLDLNKLVSTYEVQGRFEGDQIDNSFEIIREVNNAKYWLYKDLEAAQKRRNSLTPPTQAMSKLTHKDRFSSEADKVISGLVDLAELFDLMEWRVRVLQHRTNKILFSEPEARTGRGFGQGH